MPIRIYLKLKSGVEGYCVIIHVDQYNHTLSWSMYFCILVDSALWIQTSITYKTHKNQFVDSSLLHHWSNEMFDFKEKFLSKNIWAFTRERPAICTLLWRSICGNSSSTWTRKESTLWYENIWKSLSRDTWANSFSKSQFVRLKRWKMETPEKHSSATICKFDFHLLTVERQGLINLLMYLLRKQILLSNYYHKLVLLKTFNPSLKRWLWTF